MCRQDDKTIEHIFTTCTFATKIWEVTCDLGSYKSQRYNNLEEIWEDIKRLVRGIENIYNRSQE